MGGAKEEAWDTDAAERAVAVLKAVADPSRYRLLWALSRRELPVSELAELLGAHVAATSQHLAKLRAAGLVVARREGTRIFYRATEVRGLLTEAALIANDLPGRDGDGDGGAAPVVAPAEQPFARAVRAVRRRPATGQAG
ncbi:metalloregulator ArsR/SmtB family transcription factor [Kitasatospora sp. SUK 42]|uniref:ArsR/SmtB family transcription factor n=1 Tax=Kitasatospora sp. SUK 42 TaxID=1588882 RepID=UPI001C31E5BA|nr:metalloregulator ArsR/SmtB family transcription factor [Kitasatospora sp. SUK 42]MBV2156544.1 metalloregulator ArsR/SmtB family transcription factor [Kitasatospora sp. SUK 42]